ncbi:hypothetical protein FRB90_012141, partial [Tulasnella sp. 427]
MDIRAWFFHYRRHYQSLCDFDNGLPVYLMAMAVQSRMRIRRYTTRTPRSYQKSLAYMEWSSKAAQKVFDAYRK